MPDIDFQLSAFVLLHSSIDQVIIMPNLKTFLDILLALDVPKLV